MEPLPDDSSIHDAYVAHGPREYYARFGRSYRNPHEPQIAELLKRCVTQFNLDLSDVLDLAAGSGEVTLALRDVAGPTPARISAVDPFTHDAYTQRTGQACEALTFEQIACGALRGRAYSLIVCSFAMHLVESSRLPTLCMELAGVGRQMLILTPHKRPQLRPGWGWDPRGEILHQRVRARLYERAGP